MELEDLMILGLRSNIEDSRSSNSGSTSAGSDSKCISGKNCRRQGYLDG